MTAWRTAAVAVVAVLAIGIGVAAGSFLLTSRVPLGGAAAYVPASAPLYIELRVQPSDAQDAALRDVLARFGPIDGIDLDRPLHDQLVARLDRMLADEGVDASWSRDVAPWFDGHLAIAVTSLDPAMVTGDESMKHAPPAVLLLGVTDASAAQATIDRWLGLDGGPAVTDTQHGGTTIHVVGGDEPGAFALAGDQVLLGTDEASIVAMLDAHAEPSSTLAQRAGIAEMAAALPSDWLAFATYDLSSIVTTALDEATGGDGSAGPLDALLQHQPLRGAVAITAGGDRIGLDVATDQPTGPFAVENGDRGLAANVPGSALYYSESVNLGAALGAILDEATSGASAEPATGSDEDMLGSALGSELADMLTWIDDAAFVIGVDEGTPYAGLVVVPTSTEAAQRQLSQLTSLAGLGAMDPGSGVTVTTEQVAGVEVTTLRLGGGLPVPDAPIDVPPGLALQWAVTANRAFIGIGDSFVTDALTLADGASLADQARFADAVAELGGTSNAGLTWVDLDALADALPGLLGPMSPEIDGALDGFEALAPLDRFISVSRIEGGLLVQRTALLLH